MRQVNAEAWDKSASFTATKPWWRWLASVEHLICFCSVYLPGSNHCRVNGRPPSLTNNISSVSLVHAGTGNPVGSGFPSQGHRRRFYWVVCICIPRRTLPDPGQVSVRTALIPTERVLEKGGEKQKKKNTCHEKVGCTAI
jgi:hypothetical protein